MAFGGSAAYLKHLWNKEPVIMASLGIGVIALILPFVSPLTKYSRKLSLASPYYYPVPVRDDGNMPDVPQHPCEKKGNSLEWLKNF